MNGKNKPRISIEPDRALIDEPVSIVLTGFQPGQAVTVQAATHDGSGKNWRSYAVFMANPGGEIHLARQKPHEGTYHNVDPMGLFWSMQAEAGKGFSRTLKSTEVTVTAIVEGRTVASNKLTRLAFSSGVSRHSLREIGLVGELFIPEGDKKSPLILAVGGSGGGLGWSENIAALLASRGFASLALAYFGIDGLPDQLAEIPLEYFRKAINWIQARKDLAADKLGVIGVSKGGELALLLASAFPEFKAAAAYSGSGVVFNGLCQKIVSSWTRDGKPVPFVPFGDASFFSRADFSKPVPFVEFYRDNLKDEKTVKAAEIPVEKINGPVLLLSGGDDLVWPADKLSDRAMGRLKQKRYPHPSRHFKYPAAGHLTSYPYLPTTAAGIRLAEMGLTLAFGGRPETNASAAADSWPKVLKFFRDALK